MTVSSKPSAIARLVVISILFVAGCAASHDRSRESVTEHGPVVHGPVVGEWGPATDGLRTRIKAFDASWSVGQPLRVRIELQNISDRDIEYCGQEAVVNEVFVITGPDGKRVGWVGTRRQTGADRRRLAAGQTEVMLSGVDLAEDYLINHPGSYTIVNRASVGFLDYLGRPLAGLPASAPITILVTAGEVLPSRRLMENLVASLPDHDGQWHVSCTPRSGAVSEIYCSFHAGDAQPPIVNRPAGADGSIPATLSFRKSPPVAGQSEETGPRGERCDYVGPFGVVHAYLRTVESHRAAWPTMLSDVRAAVAAAN